MTKKYVMLADTVRCINCKACVVACRAEWETPMGYTRDWVKEVEWVQNDQPKVMLFPGRCQHCDDAPCIEACPSGAAYKRADGLVLQDNCICSGCELCVPACPYEARWLNPVTNTISKCTFCQPRIDKGLEPACVQTCVGRALIFGDMNDQESEVSKLLKEKEWVRLTTDEVNIGPNHYYYTAGEALPDEVMPKLHDRHLSGKTMEIVNPIGAIAIGGMLLTFLGAGVMKLIGRRNEVSTSENQEEK
ncbi:MAG: 4Fe-4S dicluster domain-containing protein [Candidatus Parabeggiatoa sp. nov. 3]|jgi:tetrathionate reductase subunit B|nr:MAG: 4Fe-4S dicluster domain-containing protein [Gammaproteobacteria bacterium]RKZ69513.1 MAG: 4Fe-4S dicluster domain-containing protein [Gammaproteobacteria bacterium]RKZ90127.1 MAG: 4Fe-4S dicluster domain-containing protein [Gammaproteobacteria bacterium]